MRLRKQPTLTGAQLRTRMIEHLSRSRPRQALKTFLDHLQSPDQSHTGRTLEGLVWIFFSYRQPRLALEALVHMHEQGYQASSRVAAKLLRSCGTEILFDSDALVKILGWIRDGITRDHQTQGKVEAHLVETVLDTLKKLGRTDWARQVFQAYRDSLTPNQVGAARVWAAAIAAHAAGSDVQAAQELFKDWRTAYMAHEPKADPTPPEPPYLALLNHFAINCPPLPASKDPAYLLLNLIKADRLPPSTAYLNALLRTELYRKRFSSFWGIWNLYDDPQAQAHGVVRDHATWKLASRAKLISDESRRQRGRLHNSPLLDLSPLPYQESHTPNSRSLFSQVLSSRLEVTSRRPALRVPIRKPDPFAAGPSAESPQASANLLNSFLSLFLSYQDYSAAVVALETFHVHRIEPTPTTHSTVVCAIIKLWEKGKLDTRDDQDLFVGSGTAREEQERRRKQRVAGTLQGPMAIEVIKTILESRKVRVRLWQQDARGSTDQEETAKGEQANEDGPEGIDSVSEPPPAWMVQRELRDTSYLVDLLERCSGLDPDEWQVALDVTRKDLLPPKKESQAIDRGPGINDETGDLVERRRRITRGARYRKERFGKEFR
ncbi:uncharacterized protein JCM15063_001565 [Sporobolomyces koalae]|uniref:uncharacterized protein n=1 Tax=Sporobolomyces koalae TaxID=500713 RepID=UPI00316F663A